MTFPHVQGDPGLSWDEIRQLNRLIAHRSDIKKPLGLVQMEAPDRAEVHSGKVWEPFGEETIFTIRKKNGRWITDESSVRQDLAIVTS